MSGYTQWNNDNAGGDDGDPGRRPSRLRFLVSHWEEIIAGVALIVVVGCVVYGVFARYVMPRPAAWSGELAGIAFTWVVFVGAASAFKRHMHIGIDAIVAMVPEVARRALEIIADLIVVAFAVAVIVLASQMAAEASGRPSAVLRIPFTFVYLAVVLGFVSILARKLMMMRERWRDGYRPAGD